MNHRKQTGTVKAAAELRQPFPQISSFMRDDLLQIMKDAFHSFCFVKKNVASVMQQKSGMGVFDCRR